MCIHVNLARSSQIISSMENHYLLLISPKKEEIHLSYKLDFDTTNNVVKYEALILGLEAARKMQITELVTSGDSKLVVQQIKGFYETRHPRMRAYKN
jgi:ribonuclease HI